jgi:hypothetical protein
MQNMSDRSDQNLTCAGWIGALSRIYRCEHEHPPWGEGMTSTRGVRRPQPAIGQDHAGLMPARESAWMISLP